MSESEMHQIFVSYASPDKDRVFPFFSALEAEGFNLWMDCKRLVAGQNWDYEIKRAFDKSSLVIVFLSRNSVGRRGYVQREMHLAIDKHTEKLIDDIYIIPVILDGDVEIPEQLKAIQAIFCTDQDCMKKLSDALKFQLGRLGVESMKAQRREEIYWTFSTKREAWDGLPGYEAQVQYVELRSERYPNVSEISEVIRGDLLRTLMSRRETKFAQDPQIFNYGQDQYIRTNSYDARCATPTIKGKVISIVYAVHTYGSGAAHSNTHFRTYSFLLDPLIEIGRLENIFDDPDVAFPIIQALIRRELKSRKYEEDPSETLLDPEWVDTGTSDWELLEDFAFKDAGIEILFAPYLVGAFACGVQTVVLPYAEIKGLLQLHFISALQLHEGFHQ